MLILEWLLKLENEILLLSDNEDKEVLTIDDTMQVVENAFKD